MLLKMGEVWFEVLRDADFSGVFPSAFDGKMLCTLLEEKINWAARIKTMQEGIVLLQKQNVSSTVFFLQYNNNNNNDNRKPSTV